VWTPSRRARGGCGRSCRRTTSKDKGGQSPEPKTVDQQLLSLARRATREALNRYQQLQGVAHLLPDGVQHSLAKSTDYAKDVYGQLTAATSLRDVSDIAISQMSAAVKNMQQVMSHTLTPALRSLDRPEGSASDTSA